MLRDAVVLTSGSFSGLNSNAHRRALSDDIECHHLPGGSCLSFFMKLLQSQYHRAVDRHHPIAGPQAGLVAWTFRNDLFDRRVEIAEIFVLD